MRWPWEYLFDKLYDRYVTLIKKYNKLEQDNTITMGNLSYEKPTQRDKPSNYSKYTLTELRKSIRLQNNEVIANVRNTNSMEPWIDENTLVVLCPVNLDKERILSGKIVVYEKGEQLIIHRVCRISDSGKSAWIEGDNNQIADGWVPLSKIKYGVKSIHYGQRIRDND